jgi:GTP-binding protein
MSALPVVALVGRPNVGKSTLFNRLTGTRDALVADFPGLTRDRQYGFASFEGKRFLVVDTGGLSPETSDPLAALAEEQAQIAIAEADLVLFLTDARAGLSGPDRSIAQHLRRQGKPGKRLVLVVNKAEGLSPSANSEFYELALGEPRLISAEHGAGVTELLREVLADFPETPEEPETNAGAIRVAVVGRPNAGKSTLINRLLGEERVLAGDQPGTTRDAISVPFRYEDQDYILIDTAGVRRRGKITEVIEKFSIIKTLQAIDSAHVVIAMVDAQAEIAEHDARLMGLIANRGRAMLLAVNKWDGLDSGQRDWIRSEIDFKLPFLDYVPVQFIAAKHGSGLRELMKDVQVVYQSAMCIMSTPELNRVLQKALDRHQPPAIVGRRIKLRYAHQGGRNPPKVIVHGNQTERLPLSYKRFLANEFRREFKLKGVPLALEFKTGDNPYKDKHNELTARQQMKRKRLMSRVKKK